MNNYTMGLSFSNMLNIKTNKGRATVTAIGTALSLFLCFIGILDNLQKLLNLAALLYPAIAGVMFVDFFLRKGKWEDKLGWNFIATLAMLSGVLVGYITTYVVVVGIPPVQSLFATCIVYYAAMKLKAKYSPDMFTAGID